MLDLDDAGKTASNKIIEAYKNKSLLKYQKMKVLKKKHLILKV